MDWLCDYGRKILFGFDKYDLLIMPMLLLVLASSLSLAAAKYGLLDHWNIISLDVAIKHKLMALCVFALSFSFLNDEYDRHQIDVRPVFEEKIESCTDIGDSQPHTKHVNPADENVDKACTSVSSAQEGVVAVDEGSIQSVGEGRWNDIQATDARIPDVREIVTEPEGSSLDIPVVVSAQHEELGSLHHQP
ncbi:hypothetical protein Dimus_019515 [Dionaea muscipula]